MLPKQLRSCRRIDQSVGETTNIQTFMYQVAPEETDDNEGTEMAVIWDFKQTTGMIGAAIQPKEKPADHMVSVPRLAFDEVSCNCTQFLWVGDIVRTPDTGAIAAQLQNLDLSSVPDVYGD